MGLRLLWGTFGSVSVAIMNQGGVPYLISNPNGPGYSTDFEHNVKGPVEHFDVYGEVQTRYSQVYWTQNSPIALPPEIVSRFDGKLMAITGYEVDQVTHSGPRPNYNAGKGDVLGGFSCYPSCDEEDMSVPIYNAYNHHYFGWLVGKDAEVYKMDEPTFVPNPTWTGLRDRPHDHSYPTNIVFKENPGGEFRKSYHGYPAGFAQFIHSPQTWIVEPMQIDTHNRNYSADITNYTGYKRWFLPQKDANSTVTQLEGTLSPLIECPCSDRVDHQVVEQPVIMAQGECVTPLQSPQECTDAVKSVVQISSARTVSDPSLPSGCLLVPDKGEDTFSAVFNQASSAQDCSFGTNSTTLRGEANLGGLTNLTIRQDATTVTLSISGPDGVWFGVGFDAGSMADLPYALIVDGQGNVQENKLAEHNPGTLLKSSVTIVSSSVTAGVRTVIVTRAVKGLTSDYYTFPADPGAIRLITAIGSSSQLSYHKVRTATRIILVPEVSSCMCAPFTTSYLIYMNTSVAEYPQKKDLCALEPRSDMLEKGDGTGRPGPNAACDAMTYNGGTRCCLHQWFLTDRNQNDLIPNQVDTYYLKWRYYFQEVTLANATKPASHQHLHHWVFLIDANVNDYEEDNANYGTQSIGNITAHLQGKDIGLEDTPANYSKIFFYVMTPHCHAPNCIREELWNADTNTLICSSAARYGNAALPFDEAGYVAMTPCLWGDQDGLSTPVIIGPETNLTAVKYFNNTFRHVGQMAQWTGLMKYDTDMY